jgi:hypothetical protein
MGARVKSKERYAALVNMWIHQNSTQFQWPTLILSAVFVAVSVLVDKETVTAIVNVEEWGANPQVQYGAGVPLLLIGVGTLAMTYAMGRNRRVLGLLEDELDEEDKRNELDPTFSSVVHPSGWSASKLIWWFLAFIALTTLWLGVLFVAGASWCPTTTIPLLVTITVWTLATVVYVRNNYGRNNSRKMLPIKPVQPTSDSNAPGQDQSTGGAARG